MKPKYQSMTFDELLRWNAACIDLLERALDKANLNDLQVVGVDTGWRWDHNGKFCFLHKSDACE